MVERLNDEESGNEDDVDVLASVVTVEALFSDEEVLLLLLLLLLLLFELMIPYFNKIFTILNFYIIRD